MAETVKKVKAPAKAKSAAKTAAEAPTTKVAEAVAPAKPRAKTVKTAEVTEKAPVSTAVGPQSVPTKTRVFKEDMAASPSRDQIAQLAHRFWKERGGHHGSHEQDWLRAERELRGRAS